MRHSIFALPALLRPAVLLASASLHSFSVNDDLYAFPQYEVRFVDDYVTELQAQAHLLPHDERPNVDYDLSSNQLGEYQSSRGEGVAEDTEEPKIEHTHMMHEGQRYLCSIPVVARPNMHEQQQQAAANDTASKAEKELELARAADRGWELLRGMQDNCVYFISGWWSYRFCYNDSVRQFHQLPPSRGVPVYPPVEDPGVEGFTLGMYAQGAESDEGEKWEKTHKDKHNKLRKGELVQRGESRYLVQRLEGGTTCDLTGRERRIEVQFHCNPQSSDRISLIKETSTCTYLMVIQTPRLCNDVAFLPPQKDQPNTISCRPILAEHEIQGYEKELKILRAAEREARVWENNPEAAAIFLGDDKAAGKLVGDVIIGGHAFVPDDVKLKKSAILGGGKEVYIDTIASSSGKTRSKEELEKLGLGDVRAVEMIKKEIERIAKGREWELKVVQTPLGREYRAIFDGEDEKENVGENHKGSEKDNEKEGSEETYHKDEL